MDVRQDYQPDSQFQTVARSRLGEVGGIGEEYAILHFALGQAIFGKWELTVELVRGKRPSAQGPLAESVATYLSYRADEPGECVNGLRHEVRAMAAKVGFPFFHTNQALRDLLHQVEDKGYVR